MFKNFRSLATRLINSLSRFSQSPRRAIKVPISVSLDIERKNGDPHLDLKLLTVNGLTQEISKSGIDFVVPFIRLGDHHLAGHGGEQKQLKLVLEMPNGRVRMTVVTKQYQMIEMHSSVQNYLIGTEIVDIYKGDVERYENFLRYGEKAALIETAAVKLAPHEDKRSLVSNS